MKTVEIEGYNGGKISLFVHETESEKVIGSVLILHGMAEHVGRYEGFINALTAAGFDAYAYDHRGHGPNIPEEELGFFGEKDGDKAVIGDAICTMKYVVENKRSEKCALFGHSMGSLIGRNVIQAFDGMDCAIFCGTGYQSDAMCKSGIALANLVCAIRGAKHRSPFLNNMMFNTKEYNRDCKRTKFDWLTHDEALVDKYIADDRCGFICTAGFYRDLVKITGQARWGMEKTRKDLPMLIASGTDDPVGSFGAAIKNLYEDYGKLGFTNVELKLYENDRHELLNEFDREKVISDFIDYLKKYM